MRIKLAERRRQSQAQDISGAKEAAKAFLEETLKRLQPAAPSYGGELMTAELIAEARMAQGRETYVSDCPLLAAMTDKPKPSQADLRRKAAEILGDMMAWKQSCAGLMRAMKVGLELIAAADGVSDVNRARDQAVEWLREVPILH